MEQGTYVETGFKMKAGVYNSKQVLEYVMEKIRKEPKRLFMPTWVSMVKGKVVDPYNAFPKVAPKCGTAACVGGHIGLAVRDEITYGNKALNLLGMSTAVSEDRWDNVFDDNLSNELNEIFGHTEDTPKQILKELERFVVRNKERLEGLKVVVPTRESLREEAREKRQRPEGRVR